MLEKKKLTFVLGAQVRVFGFQVGCRTLEEDGQESGRGVLEVDHHERRHPGTSPARVGAIQPCSY